MEHDRHDQPRGVEAMSEHSPGETPGEEARRLVNEAKVALNDPRTADYHERLRAAIDRMEGELDFWNQLRMVNEIVDIALEAASPPPS
jgi:hypothetical protein